MVFPSFNNIVFKHQMIMISPNVKASFGVIRHSTSSVPDTVLLKELYVCYLALLILTITLLVELVSLMTLLLQIRIEMQKSSKTCLKSQSKWQSQDSYPGSLTADSMSFLLFVQDMQLYIHWGEKRRGKKKMLGCFTDYHWKTVSVDYLMCLCICV